MNFPKTHYDIMENSVMISGIFRSGTTLTGKIMGSFRNVEYSFEPPLSYHIDFLIQEKRIDPETAVSLLRTYLAENVMLDYHHGRGYNMRPSDDSCIFKTKEYKDVMIRWEKVKGVQDAVKLMKELNSRLIFKVPAAYSMIPCLAKQFKGFKVIEVQRNLRAILSSALAKGWFSEKSLTNEEYPPVWPYFKENAFQIPYFVWGKNEFAELNEVERTMKALTALTEKGLKMRELLSKDSLMVVKYEDILEEPDSIFTKIADFTGMEFTPKTEHLLGTIRKTKRAYDVNELLGKTSKELLDKFEELNKKIGY